MEKGKALEKVVVEFLEGKNSALDPFLYKYQVLFPVLWVHNILLVTEMI